jgi:hypothetical protein
MTSRPALAALAALLVATLSVAGCVSMPSGGPVQSYPVTQGPDTQNQPYVQIVPQPPGAGWSPTEIVQGFLTASASIGAHGEVAQQYLTSQGRKHWAPAWSAIVYKEGPDVTGAIYPSSSTAKKATTATVQITGSRQAILKGYGSYSLPSSSAPDQSYDPQPVFHLVKVAGGQWRISDAPNELLLTSDSFKNDYQLQNLYFFDPMYRFLVPDPIYVPVQAKPGDLMNGLVSDLITPLKDWLSAGATVTALPPGTKISDVTLDGVTAVVNLTGTITKATNDVMQLVSAQLLWTLAGPAQSGATGQTVQSVEVEVNGKPWTPLDSQGNPVQLPSKKRLPLGDSQEFYYVDSSGNLNGRVGPAGKPVSIAKIGTGFTQIAVSPDGTYLAALRGSTLYTGLVGSTLTKRGTGYVAMSWDVNDDLWASAGDQIVVFRTAASGRQPLGQKAAVDVAYASVKNLTIPFTALRVAPDGVRVAIVIAGTELTFGAISGQQGPSPQITLSSVQLSTVSPANTFTGLAWYGPDNVITLAGPSSAVTEYPVSGGTPTPITPDSRIQTIAASSGQSLIIGLPKGQMMYDASLTGSWIPIDGVGSAPTYPG